MTGLSVLAIDLGTVSVRALLDRGDGRAVVPLLVDRHPASPPSRWPGADTQPDIPTGSGAQAPIFAAGSRMAAPLRQLGGDPVELGGIAADPTQVVAWQLAEIAARAATDLGGPPERVVIGVPPGWGPRRDRLLSTVAVQAGLPEPQVVPESIAAVCRAVGSGGLDPGAGDCILVCDLGAASADLSVVQYQSPSARQSRPTTAGWAVLATRPCPPLAGLHIDQALLEEIAARDGTDPTRWQRLRAPATTHDWNQRHELADQIEQAKHRLAGGNPAAVVLTAPQSAVVLEPHILDRVLGPTLVALQQAASQVLVDADVDATDVHMVVCVGGGAGLPGVAAALRARFETLPVIVPAAAHLAVAHGLLDAVTPAAPL